jgi:hypothetical protein
MDEQTKWDKLDEIRRALGETFSPNTKLPRSHVNDCVDEQRRGFRCRNNDCPTCDAIDTFRELIGPEKPTRFYDTMLANTDYSGLDIIELFKAMQHSAWDFPSAMSSIGLNDLCDGDLFTMHPTIADARRVLDYILANNDEDTTDLNRDEFLTDFPLEWDT